jgi:hypothetical protein
MGLFCKNILSLAGFVHKPLRNGFDSLLTLITPEAGEKIRKKGGFHAVFEGKSHLIFLFFGLSQRAAKGSGAVSAN